MNTVINIIRAELKNNIDEKTLATGQIFFKEEVKRYGVKTETVRKISKNEFKILKSRSKSEVFELCEELWKSGYMEESFIACDWSYSIHKKYEPADFQIFENWIKTYVNNWASCDTFCNHTMGAFLEMYPEYLPGLKTFAKSENRWMRRAAAVSLIIPARKGLFLNDILEIATILLDDKDDLVQKGYGWMLKVASQSHQKEIFDFVMENKSNMPRTALRYAIEKMPKDLKLLAMKA
ncbi:3-methyladenine DNA glycosylase AlkD [Daejeonella rubra]|uniref:3-methyladenine DNA glycosylase AlkD n=1 Tax=Daejeonella rubra TaxID=990371 RepID=A0A1G9YTJ7_9SPHI|nr:DNA alkylation repair protein [Daejeonella rubra]SDN11716.1 3-methyladenine DNA glycosylase AlkD [Daejeonella rubra]